MSHTGPVVLPTLAMLAVLACASMAVYAVAVCAPVAAPELGVATTLIGTYSAIVYGTAMFAGLQTEALMAAFGPIRLCQLSVLLCAIAMAVFTLATPLAALVSALLLGCAYGQGNPASAHILVNLGAPRWRALIFSLKQTGVPIGGALAGLLLPTVLAHWHWPLALAIVAALALLTLPLLEPLRGRFDGPRRQRTRLQLRFNLRGPLRLVLQRPELRGIALAALIYGGGQLCVGSFLVAYLAEARHLPLVLAGSLFAALQVGGIAGRILWGLVAAGRIAPRRLLGLIGLITTAGLLLVTLISAAWPRLLLLGLSFVLGASAFGWNGIFLAETARMAPVGQAGPITGAVQFFIYSGVVVLPPAFGLLVELTGSYTPAFTVTAVLVALASLYFLHQPATEL